MTTKAIITGKKGKTIIIKKIIKKSKYSKILALVTKEEFKQLSYSFVGNNNVVFTSDENEFFILNRLFMYENNTKEYCLIIDDFDKRSDLFQLKFKEIFLNSEVNFVLSVQKPERLKINFV